MPDRYQIGGAFDKLRTEEQFKSKIEMQDYRAEIKNVDVEKLFVFILRYNLQNPRNPRLEIENIIRANYAKRTQSVKRNAGQVLDINVYVSSVYRWIMKKNRIGYLMKTNPNESKQSQSVKRSAGQVFCRRTDGQRQRTENVNDSNIRKNLHFFRG
jgi:hypothetical protein